MVHDVKINRDENPLDSGGATFIVAGVRLRCFKDSAGEYVVDKKAVGDLQDKLVAGHKMTKDDMRNHQAMKDFAKLHGVKGLKSGKTKNE